MKQLTDFFELRDRRLGVISVVLGALLIIGHHNLRSDAGLSNLIVTLCGVIILGCGAVQLFKPRH
jgi:hypothetical protein